MRVLILIALALALVSCGKREPERSPASGELISKVCAQFGLGASVGQGALGGADFSKIENFAIRRSEQGEVGVFKLYSKSSAEYIKNISRDRLLSLQGLEPRIANTGEVRSYGNYVYYAAHGQKDKIFKIIEDGLRGDG